MYVISFMLQKTHSSAVATRDLARQNQHRREVALLSEAKERERRLVDCRKTAEERKHYFESMERHMFATRSSVKVLSSGCSIFQRKSVFATTFLYDVTCFLRNMSPTLAVLNFYLSGLKFLPSRVAKLTSS